MAWYYSQNGQSVGPVNDDQFQSLVRAGVIEAETHVWKEGMADWKLYKELPKTPATGFNTSDLEKALARASAEALSQEKTVATPAAAGPGGEEGPSAAAGPRRTCAQCGKDFPEGEMIQYENSWVCADCKPLFFQKLREGVRVDTGLDYAGFWVRFGAKFIDGLVGLALYFTILLPLQGLLAWTAKPGEAPAQVLAHAGLSTLMNMALNVAYLTFFVGRYGGSLGKLALGLRIVNPDGGKVSYLKAFGRYFGEIVTGFTLTIGYLMAAWDPQKRALHDRICATRVVKKH